MTKERVAIKGVFGAVLAAAAMVSGPVDAVLIDRGGGLIYDDVLDITWLQDANYAQSSGLDPDGRMTWDEAVAWADALVYGGYDDWRLPIIVDVGDPGCDFGFDCGYNVLTTAGGPPAVVVRSEMASLFYDTLGNVSPIDWMGDPTGCRFDCLQNTGPFSNLQADLYWSSTEWALNPASAWNFRFYDGEQRAFSKEGELFAWAVRPGDVAVSVPEPGTLGLLGAGLALLGLNGTRRRAWFDPLLLVRRRERGPS